MRGYRVDKEKHWDSQQDGGHHGHQGAQEGYLSVVSPSQHNPALRDVHHQGVQERAKINHLPVEPQGGGRVRSHQQTAKEDSPSRLPTAKSITHQHCRTKPNPSSTADPIPSLVVEWLVDLLLVE